jgi:hypothetical protein
MKRKMETFLVVFESFLSFFENFLSGQKLCIGGFRCGWSVEMIFQFAPVLSPMHNKTNIFKLRKATVLLLAQDVYV